MIIVSFITTVYLKNSWSLLSYQFTFSTFVHVFTKGKWAWIVSLAMLREEEHVTHPCVCSTPQCRSRCSFQSVLSPDSKAASCSRCLRKLWAREKQTNLFFFSQRKPPFIFLRKHGSLVLFSVTDITINLTSAWKLAGACEGGRPKFFRIL